MSYGDERTEIAVRLNVEISTRTTVYRYSLRTLRVHECTYFRCPLVGTTTIRQTPNTVSIVDQEKRPPGPDRGLGRDENIIARKYTDEIAIEAVRDEWERDDDGHDRAAYGPDETDVPPPAER